MGLNKAAEWGKTRLVGQALPWTHGVRSYSFFTWLLISLLPLFSRLSNIYQSIPPLFSCIDT